MNFKPIDLSAAQHVATQFLGQPVPATDFSFVMLDDCVIERPKCFVFFYESSKFLATDNFEDRLVGNAPILVDRETGVPRLLGTAEPVESYIAAFEAEKEPGLARGA
jgi:hypothetical protein